MMPLQAVVIAPTFESWRLAARDLLARGVAPDSVLWQEQDDSQSLLFAESPPLLPSPARASARFTVHVSKAFLELARGVAAHRDERRWAVLYSLLWQMAGGESRVLEKATDPEVRLARSWQKSISRDIHKMHAFVRFCLVEKYQDHEFFAAWFEPEHRILPLAVPFFVKRFAGMNWSILTPDACAHWDGTAVHFSAGVPRECAPRGDTLEDLWRSYYRSIFNPARLKVQAMKSEMPRKFWSHLPEAAEIPALVQKSTDRVQNFLLAPAKKPTP